MVLQMARPFRHPDSGIYWFRKRVPINLRTILGKTEEKVSLRTRDPATARIAHGKMTAEVEARWAGLCSGTQELSHKQAVALAGEFYRTIVGPGEEPPRSRSYILIDFWTH